MSNLETRFFDIQKASESSGVSAHTIRAWEKRYQAVKPQRSVTGKRMYNQLEIERLRTLALLVNLGTSIGQIARLPNDDLQPMLDKLSTTKDRYSSPRLSTWPAPPKDILDNLLVNLQNFKMHALTQQLMGARTALSTRDFVFHLLLPLVAEARNLLAQTKLNQTQFQALFSVIRFYASTAITPLSEKASRKKFYIASIDGVDTFTPIMTALLLSHYEKNFFYSHVSLPIESMFETAQALSSHVIIMHFEHQLSPQQFTRITELLPPQLQVLIGMPGLSDMFHKNVQFYQSFEQLDTLLRQDPS